MSQYTSIKEFCIVWCWKPIGSTPGECIDYITKISYDDNLTRLLNDTNNRISFACRLDPMACGILPIVIANQKKIKNICEGLQNCFKVYTFSVIKGIRTDSCDILGMITKSNDVELKLEEISKKEAQKYPIYSSKTIKDPKSGKMRKLFEFANENRVGEIKDIIPSHPIEIKYIKQINKETKTGQELIEYINISIDILKTGEFRINDIKKSWSDGIDLSNNYEILSFEAKVSSGTYIRGLADDMGGTAFDICRIEICDKYPTKEMTPNYYTKMMNFPKIIKIIS